MRDMQTIRWKRKRPAEWLLYACIYLSALLSVLLLLLLLTYLFYKGIGCVDLKFLTSVPSVLKGSAGIAGNIVNTLYLVVLTLLIVLPLGIGSAVYLNEYAKPGKLVRLIEFTTEILSGIPSVIFGLFGMVFFGKVLGFGYSILTGSFTLAIMVLPLITRNTQEALRAVPESYRSGALGIGAAKWYMIRTILLPSAMPGILTGIILAVGRIIGESAALLFTAGSGYLLPSAASGLRGWLHKILESGGSLTVQLYLSMSKAQYETAFGIAVVLLVIVCILNLLTHYFAGKFETAGRGEKYEDKRKSYEKNKNGNEALESILWRKSCSEKYIHED